MTRRCTPENVNALKTAFKRVLFDVGGLLASAASTRVGPSQLSDYGNISCDKIVPVDVVLDLELISGQPHITSALAQLQGYDLVARELMPAHELIACLQRISEDNGQLFAQALHAVGGAALTATERASMIASAVDVQRASSELIAILSQGETDS